MAIKYIPYFPNTLEGQAVLDNFYVLNVFSAIAITTV